ncbi:MAG: hypothetical protein DI537_10320 [Stutzerimonas stutzeri]|nr:MAG: hypothetical protein DI537_10320 [Stutzerimonas stutzeri]
MTEIAAHEKVGAIFDCYVRNGTRTGAFGHLRVLSSDIFLIEIPGQEFTVRRWIGNWAVSHRGYEGLGSSVEDAAYLALDQFRSASPPSTTNG